MPADLKVVEISSPPLTDIPAHLRKLADAIEAGEHGEVGALFAVMPVEGGYPTVWGWGDIERKNDPVIQFELAKMWLLTNLTIRE